MPVDLVEKSEADWGEAVDAAGSLETGFVGCVEAASPVGLVVLFHFELDVP